MIHSTAIIHESVVLPKDIEVGPYSIIHEGVKLGDGNQIHSQVEIHPYTQLGKNNIFYKGAVIGGHPQDRSFLQEENKIAKLFIGDNNIFREYTTVHHGTESVTQIGNNNYFMAYSHIAHDCRVGNDITIANYSALAGWVEVQDYAFLSGHVLVHQHCRIGEYVMIGGLCRINQDIAPFSLIAQENGKIAGINMVGLKRRGYSFDKIKKLQKVFNFFTKRKGFNNTNLENLIHEGISKEIQVLEKFFEESKKGVTLKWLKYAK